MDEIRVDPERAAPTDSNLPAPVNPAVPHAAPDFGAAVQPSYVRVLFFDSDGLRPGWGVGFYLTSIFFLLWFVSLISAALPNNSLGTLRRNLLNETVLLAVALLPAIVLARVECRSWRDFGLPLRQIFGKQFWIGAVWGFVGITLLIFAIYGLHGFSFGHVVMHGARLVKFAGYWAAMFLAVGLAEEFLFRGYTQFTLARGIGFWWAALALSSAFGAVHWSNPGETFTGVLGAAVIGLFFCLTLRRTGNLWFAVGFHAAWDWGETFFYSVPDSGLVAPGHLLSSSFHGPSWLTGGSVGPEGSVLCLLVVGILWGVFSFVYPAGKSTS